MTINPAYLSAAIEGLFYLPAVGVITLGVLAQRFKTSGRLSFGECLTAGDRGQPAWIPLCRLTGSSSWC